VYFFTHLLAGVLIGLVIYYLTRDWWTIAAAAVGSVIPDLLDKPLGYIVMADSLDYGRIYFHTFFFFLAVIAIGVLVYYRKRSWVVIALGAGVLSHQLLDSMWEDYWNWFWPWFGPFYGYGTEYYFLDRLYAELTDPWEWLFCSIVVIVGVVLIWLRGSDTKG
jgi:membrane-bound metal-dependent hydrolase YbcI (DUF457 family)